VGLRNTRERLQAMYGDRHAFALHRTEPHGLSISIRIPFET
jgi:sensor histidine kinase YesM